MADTITVKVTGAEELRAVPLRAQDVFLPRELKWAHEQAAEVVVDAAGPAVPRRSGNLARSLRATGTLRTGYARAGNAQVPYAAAIHWGRTRGNVGRPPGNHPGGNVIRGRPFLRNAAIRSQHQIIDQFEEAMSHLVASISAGGAK